MKQRLYGGFIHVCLFIAAIKPEIMTRLHFHLKLVEFSSHLDEDLVTMELSMCGSSFVSLSKTRILPPHRCLLSQLGTKSFIRLFLTLVIFCSTQKRGNRFSSSSFPNMLICLNTVRFYSLFGKRLY